MKEDTIAAWGSGHADLRIMSREAKFKAFREKELKLIIGRAPAWTQLTAEERRKAEPLISRVLDECLGRTSYRDLFWGAVMDQVRPHKRGAKRKWDCGRGLQLVFEVEDRLCELGLKHGEAKAVRRVIGMIWEADGRKRYGARSEKALREGYYVARPKYDLFQSKLSKLSDCCWGLWRPSNPKNSTK